MNDKDVYKTLVKTMSDAVVEAFENAPQPTLNGLMLTADICVEVIARLASKEGLGSEAVEGLGEVLIKRIGNGLIAYEGGREH